MSDNSGKNQDYVARGLKAAIHNDNVSDDAKESAAQRLEQMGAEVPADYRSGAQSGNDEYKPESDNLNSNQKRGYKSALARDNVSDEAKGHARDMLEDDNREAEFSDSDGDYAEPADYTGGETTGGDVHHGGETNRVLGGYKATLKNPNISDKAKKHAEEVLHEAYN